MRITSSMLLFAALLIAGCGWISPTGGDGPIRVERGEEFWLKVGQTATTPDGAALTFESLVEDSRCPEGARCIVAGRVQVAVVPSEPTVRYAVPDTLTLGDIHPPDHQQVGPFRLLDVRPYPGVDRPQPDLAFLVAQFVIE